MSYRQEVAHSTLTDALYYNERFGIFVWRKGRQGIRAGSIAGTVNGRGYVGICINGVSYLAHRLAWFYVNGEWPKLSIDHINHKKTDNSISNLRDVSQSENSRNMLQRRDSPLGVYWSKEKRLWESRVWDGSKNHFLGRFKDKEDAITARKAAEVQYGYHKNHSGE